MKKTRNSFFGESNMNYAYINPMNMPNIPNMPMQSASQYNSFYQTGNPYIDSSDIESRLAKIERQINRLEHRINKLETTNTYITDDIENQTNNMYML